MCIEKLVARLSKRGPDVNMAHNLEFLSFELADSCSSESSDEEENGLLISPPPPPALRTVRFTLPDSDSQNEKENAANESTRRNVQLVPKAELPEDNAPVSNTEGES